MNAGRICAMKLSTISEVKKINQIAREAGGEGSSTWQTKKWENISKIRKCWRGELEDLVKSSTEEEETEVEPAMWTKEKFG